MRKIIVLAGSRIEFEGYLNSMGMTDNEALYGYMPDVMAGVEASKVEIIGTFWDRKDANKLKEFAESRIK